MIWFEQVEFEIEKGIDNLRKELIVDGKDLTEMTLKEAEKILIKVCLEKKKERKKRATKPKNKSTNDNKC